MKSTKVKRLRFKRWLLTIILGKQLMHVINISLYKSQKEADSIGNQFRSKFLGDIMQLFEIDY